jgi:hypothetical protein
MPTVRIGPGLTNLKKYAVNDDKRPFFVNSPHFTGYVTVRLRNHQCKNDPHAFKTSSYFENHRRLFSFQFQGRFKASNTRHQDGLWSYDDILFCAETESAVSPPMGASLVVKFARYIDPGFTADAMFLDKRPWVGSWLVCGMNSINAWQAEIDEKLGTTNIDINHSQSIIEQNEDNIIQGTMVPENKSLRQSERTSNPLLPIGPWVYYGRHHLEEDSKLLLPEKPNLSGSKRRTHFLDAKTRQSHYFDPDIVYAFDFFNNFTNFSTMNADMFIKFSMSKVLRNQPLRFVCRDKSGENVFFAIEIDYSDIC